MPKGVYFKDVFYTNKTSMYMIQTNKITKNCINSKWKSLVMLCTKIRKLTKKQSNLYYNNESVIAITKDVGDYII